ncbi:MAG: hypothetical protein ACI97N_000586, partial [Cognaticolwellia sp.]
MTHEYIILNMKPIIYILLVIGISSCKNEPSGALFTKLSANKTGIDFRNLLKENENFNIFKYHYFNNGGGVAVGDFNNDGLQDLVFTGNMVKNRLYINQGDFEFEDVTQTSGIASKEGWCTGVTTVDINEDGWLDIYISRAGYPFDDLRHNLLFINNGDLTFTEKAAEYGLADLAYSTHSAFFDYDKDGDLDFFSLNHSTTEYSKGSQEVIQVRQKKNPNFTNKLFRNDNGKFTNVTEVSGIHSNVLTFSLGISVADINGDNWADIFIGNDFNEPDYLFINQQDGTFTDAFAETFDHSSMFSMGSDVADFNNDGLLDYVSLDMLPEGNYAQKMHSGADNFDKVTFLERNGFQNQYSRNMLQLNNGDGTFSEVGQLSGISNTDWSWAPLFFDFDNDGLKDLFIANGYPKDHTNMDFLTFTANEVTKINQGKDHVDFDGYMEKMPAITLPNYFYQNKGNLKFENQAKKWGLTEPIVSQSAAYADLDNDGDLDLITNNTGDFAYIYKNNSDKVANNNYLRIQLKGRKSNAFGIGSKVKVYADGQVFFQEQQLVRGFQSSVDPILNFGLGKATKIDSVVVIWTTDERQVLTNIQPNQRIEIDIKNAKKEPFRIAKSQNPYFRKTDLITATHHESNFSDFKIQSLLPWFYSRENATIAVGDVNGDNRADIYLGNAKGSSGQLLIQTASGNFSKGNNTIFEKSIQSEDSEALFFDANNDGKLDLYVGSGSYEFSENDANLQDRLYLNNGHGNFIQTNQNLPNIPMNTTCIASADVDLDGDLDLFVGGGYIYGKYPQSYKSQLLINNGKGVFENKPTSISTIGSVKDAIWLDLNKNKNMELIVVSEWHAISIFEYKNNALTDVTEKYIDTNFNGLWHTIHAADFDGDGDEDLVIGNLGLNSQLSATSTEPLELFHGDFDDNGSVDPLLCYYIDGKSYPFISRDDLIGQLPHLKKNYLYFEDYANAQIQDILTKGQFKMAKKQIVTTLETIYLENNHGKFIKKDLPMNAQIAPVHAIQSFDVNNDGNLDIITGGNTLNTRVKLGRLDGNHGQILLGNGKGNFKPMPYAQSNFNING